jgi:hypothetical protein
LGKDASAEVLRGSEKTHSGQDVPDATDVVTMSQVRACARALLSKLIEDAGVEDLMVTVADCLKEYIRSSQ